MKFYHSPEKKRSPKIPQIKIYKKWIWAGIAATVLVFSALAYVIFFSPAFKIKKIEASGVHDAISAELIRNLNDYFANQSKISSLLGSQNILIWGDSDGFLKTHPQFEILKIDKSYFSREIRIEAKEREKYGLWCRLTKNNAELTLNNTDNSSSTENYRITPGSFDNTPDCWWIDPEGIIFSKAPAIDSELFNRINDNTNRDLRPGNPVLEKNLFANLKKIFNIINISEATTKTLYLDDLSLEEVANKSDPKMIFSLRIDPEFSLSAINSLKSSDKWKKIDYIDFRVENRAYYKLK